MVFILENNVVRRVTHQIVYDLLVALESIRSLIPAVGAIGEIEILEFRDVVPYTDASGYESRKDTELGGLRRKEIQCSGITVDSETCVIILINVNIGE